MKRFPDRQYSIWPIIMACTHTMSAVLFCPSLHYDGGMALLATVMLSLLSTNTGITNKWKPSPNDPKPGSHSPTGDAVIKYPKCAFIIV